MLKLLHHIYNILIPPKIEVITAAPFRIEPGMPVPLNCLVKGQTPFRLESIKVAIKQEGRTIRAASVLKKPVEVHPGEWHKVILIPLPDKISGNFEIETIVRVWKNGKIRTIRNDSFPGGRKRPLHVFRARYSLPRFSNFCFGDLHYHCYNAGNAKSFGTSLSVSAEAAKALGLHFFAVTGKMNEMDDKKIAHTEGGNGTWEIFKKKVETWNSRNEFVILPGEEIRCKNHQGRDVDLIILHLPGPTGSSKRTQPQVRNVSSKDGLKELLSRVDSSAVAFAVHPVKETSLLDRWFFSRGRWSKYDLTLSGLTGLQVYNGQREDFLELGLKKWIELLLRGERKFILAGSEAHADFNRTKKPHDTFNFNGNNSFGKARTGILYFNPITPEKIVASLKRGTAVITNGPLMDFTVRNEAGKRSLLGGELSGALFTIKFRAVSTPEYGSITKLRLYSGIISARTEEAIYTMDLRDTRYSLKGEVSLEPRGEYSYIRGELRSGDSGNTRFCFTNPIWLRQQNG